MKSNCSLLKIMKNNIENVEKAVRVTNKLERESMMHINGLKAKIDSALDNILDLEMMKSPDSGWISRYHSYELSLVTLKKELEVAEAVHSKLFD